MGVCYHQFTLPKGVTLKGGMIDDLPGREAKGFMELLIPQGAEVLAAYEHAAWSGYAAVTRSHFGRGTGVYLGCMTDDAVLERILGEVLRDAGVKQADAHFPVIVRSGENDFGRRVTFLLNYSGSRQTACAPAGTNLLSGERTAQGERITLEPWNLAIIEAD